MNAAIGFRPPAASCANAQARWIKARIARFSRCVTKPRRHLANTRPALPVTSSETARQANPATAEIEHTANQIDSSNRFPDFYNASLLIGSPLDRMQTVLVGNRFLPKHLKLPSEIATLV
jgi:hypothetical protein